DRPTGAGPRSDVQRHGVLQGTARAAQLGGGEPPVDPVEGPPVPGRFVLKHGDELRPARVMYALGQSRAREPGHRKVLHVYRLVLADDLRGKLVCPVPARVGQLGVQLGDPGPGLGPVHAALLLAGQCLLRLAQAAFGSADETRIVDLPAVRQHGEMRQPQVYPNLARRLRERLAGDLYHEAREVPSGRVLDHRYRRRCGRQSTGPADFYLADLGHVQPPVWADAEAVAGESDRLPVVLLRLEPGRGHLRPLALARYRGEERPVRLVQVVERL